MRGDLNTTTNLISNHGLCLKEQSINKYGWTPLHTACYFGQVDIVEYLVTELAVDVNQTNNYGWNSFVFALYGGHLDIIDFLLFECEINLE